MATDYVPAPDDKFDAFQDTFVGYVIANGAALGVTRDEAAALSAKQTAWGSAFGAHTAAEEGIGLSKRERDLMRCLFEKLADKEIAERMGIGLAMVHTHLHRLYNKLNVHNRAEAVRKYLTGKSAS